MHRLAPILFTVQRARSYIYEAVKGGVGTKLLGIIDLEQSGSFVKVLSLKTILNLCKLIDLEVRVAGL